MVQKGSLAHSEKNLFSNAPPYFSYFIFLIFLSIITIILDHKYQRLETLRTYIDTLLFPIYTLSDTPAKIDIWLDEYWGERAAMLAEKEKLQNDNLFLSQKLQKYDMLEAENDRLRNLLNMSQSYFNDRAQIASVVVQDASHNPNELTIDKGIADGVYLGQPVLDSRGLFGRIVHVAYNTSTLLLITSPKHFTPVQAVNNSYRSTAAGTGSLDNLKLLRVKTDSGIKIGDTLITSGAGGVFPPGYKFGTVAEIGKPQDNLIPVSVRPFANIRQTQEVLLIWPQDKNPLSKDAPNKDDS